MTARDAASERQVQAADPAASTWLSANAGSGKTRVLIDRVARLLLNGVQPQRILCLTYTKAAASEMQNRLFRRLGCWAMLPDAALRAELGELGADGAVDADKLAQARRLFARAIETPGGLKIQTIHSFCAGLLRRFPLEAGVSPQFIEMDDRAGELLREAIVEEMATGAAVANPWTKLMAKSESFISFLAASCSGPNTVSITPPPNRIIASNKTGPQALPRRSSTGPSTAAPGTETVMRGGLSELDVEREGLLRANQPAP